MVVKVKVVREGVRPAYTLPFTLYSLQCGLARASVGGGGPLPVRERVPLSSGASFLCSPSVRGVVSALLAPLATCCHRV